MSARPRTRWLVGGGAALLLGSCRTQPDFARPDVSAQLAAQYVGASDDATPQAETPASEAPSRVRWWTRFEDPVLEEWVGIALEHNLDLRVVAARLAEAEASARAAGAARWPAIDGSLVASRSVANVGPVGRVYANDFGPRFQASWSADLFGRLSSAQRSALAGASAAALDHEALEQLVVTAVLRERVALSVVERRLGLARDVVQSRSQTLEVVDRRFRSGVPSVSAVDLRLAQENLASAEAALPALELERTLEQHALDVLLGRPSRAELVAPPPFLAMPPGETLALGVPAALLDQRPDLRAAEFRVRAAYEGQGVALADLYPDLLLRGDLGWRSEELSRLLSPDKLFADAIAQLTQRLFDRGRRRAEVDAARARTQAQAVNYAGLVLEAVREVEDALAAERLLAERIAAVERQVEHARVAESLARDRYGRGLENLLTVLETERRRQGAEDQLLLLQGRRWNARLDLHLALGGTWTPEPAASAAPRTDP